MLLNRGEIQRLLEEREITINPFEEALLGRASYDLRLSDKVIDPESGEVIELTDFQLLPGQFVLANTLEYLVLSEKVAGLVMGRSSLARLGVLTTLDAHLVEPGFEGSLTLTLKNVSNKPVLLRGGLAVVHVAFMRVVGNGGQAKRESKYEKEEQAVVSKLCREIGE